MHRIVKFKGIGPKIHKTAYLADGVVIAADVSISENVSIWFNSVIRGDVAPITVGKNTNIQDGCVIHTSRFSNGKTLIGSNVTIGHMSLIHACKIHDNAFIGMHATVMDQAIIEEYGFVGAGSLVPPGKIIRKKQLWLGNPAKFVRNVTDTELEFMRDNIKNYLDLSTEYKNDV